MPSTSDEHGADVVKIARLWQFLFLAISLPLSCSGGRLYSPGHSRDRYENRRDEVFRECESLPAEHWAGQYFHFFGYDYFDVVLAPKAGAVYHHSTDVVGDEVFYFGSVTEKDGKITIDWEDKKKGPMWLSELFVVQSGERRFLVATIDAPAFGVAVRKVKNPASCRPFWAFERYDPEEGKPGGELKVPDAFKKNFEPIVTTVAAFGDEESGKGSHKLRKQITIAAGEAEGVMLNMRFQVPDHGRQPVYEVKAVREHEADAEAIEYSDIDPVVPLTLGMGIATVAEFEDDPWGE
jgi:hypothetical protein